MGMDDKQLAQLKSGKTPTQAKCIDYFCKDPGCFSSNPSDEWYNAEVKKQLDKLNTQERALDKLGVDIDQVNEIAPVNFHGFDYDGVKYFHKQNSGHWVTPKYELLWLFFSDTQIYLYKCAFDMFNNRVDESTLEYFYKDITAFRTSTMSPKEETAPQDIRYEEFSVIVPGDRVDVSLSGTEENSSAIIAGMKQKLREKKNS